MPGIAPAAKQMGQYVAAVIAARVSGRAAPDPFEYRHKGDFATIGRKAAVVNLKGVSISGFLGWALWGVAHVYFLIGMRNRIAVAFSWLWDWATFGRGARLITEPANAAPSTSFAGLADISPGIDATSADEEQTSEAAR